MKRSRVTTLAVALAALGSLNTAGVASAAPPPIDASTHHITCNTVIGTIKLKPPLINGGSEPSAAKIKAKLDGCTVTDSNDIPVAITITGQVKGTITASSNDCFALLGSQPASGALTVKWKSSAALLNAASAFNTATLTGNGFLAPFPVSAGYSQFSLSGVATGSFAGPGTMSWITSEDLGVFLTRCGEDGNKALTLGIGQLDLGN